MRRIELLLKMPPESQRRRRLPRRAGGSHAVWLAALTVLIIAYARNQSGIPEQTPAATVTPVEPAAQPVASHTPVASPLRPAPPAQPSSLTPGVIAQPPAATVTPAGPAAQPAATRTPVAPPPRPAPRTPAQPSSLTPSEAQVDTRGALAPDPPELVFGSRLVRSGSAGQTDSERRSDGQVEIRRRSTVTSEMQITSEIRSVSITNTGTAPVRIGSAGLARIESEVFVIAGDSCSGKVLAPGEGCHIRIRFLAEDAGTYSSRLSVPSDAAPLAIPVNATVTIVDQPSRK